MSDVVCVPVKCSPDTRIKMSAVWDDKADMGLVYEAGVKAERVVVRPKAQGAAEDLAETLYRTACSIEKEQGGHNRSDLLFASAALIRQQDAVIGELAQALWLILPLAKGYAAQHEVGSNQAYIENAEEALAAARLGKEGIK